MLRTAATSLRQGGDALHTTWSRTLLVAARRDAGLVPGNARTPHLLRSYCQRSSRRPSLATTGRELATRLLAAREARPRLANVTRALHTSVERRLAPSSSVAKRKAAPTPEELFPETFKKGKKVVKVQEADIEKSPLAAVRDEASKPEARDEAVIVELKDSKPATLNTDAEKVKQDLDIDPTQGSSDGAKLEKEDGKPPTEEEMQEMLRALHRQGMRISFKNFLRYCRAPSIFGATSFSILLSGVIFLGAAVYSVEHTHDMAAEIARGSRGGTFGDFSSFFGMHGNDRPPPLQDVISGEGRYSEQQLRAAHMHTVALAWGSRLNGMLAWCDSLGLGDGTKKVVTRCFNWTVASYVQLPNYQMAAVPIVAINATVFAAWSARSALPFIQSIRWNSFMETAFIHKASGRLFTLLTSVFSHQGIAHFAFNNIALWSCGAAALISPAFIDIARAKDGPAEKHVMDASVTPHFLAFFASAGIFASLISHLRNAVIWRVTAARKGLMPAAMIGMRGGLGASGAVYAVFAMMAEAYPENRLSLIFLPSASLPIHQGFRLMLLVDALGLVFRWRLFDHTAHLAGAAFGYLYYKHGGHFWESMKRRVVAFKARHDVTDHAEQAYLH